MPTTSHPTDAVNPNELSRVELLALAQSLRVPDADVMTRGELREAINEARKTDTHGGRDPVTWVGVARRLLASIVEQGLNLPDAAALIRGDARLSSPPKAPPPVATVTLARIYAAQGHVDKALATVREVLAGEPDHERAASLKKQLEKRLETLRAAAAAAQNAAAQNAAAQNAAAMSANDSPAKREPTTHEPTAHEPASDSPAKREPATHEPASEATTAGSRHDNGASTTSLRESPGHDATPPPADDATPADDAVAKSDSSRAASTPEPAPAALAPHSPAVADRSRPPAPPPQLVVLERASEAGARYLYWERATNAGHDPLGLRVVGHVPAPSGALRLERWLPITASRGAYRIEGLPDRVVVRAMVARRDRPRRPLAVAACLSSDAGHPDGPWSVSYRSSSRDDATALARRAADVLETARATVW